MATADVREVEDDADAAAAAATDEAPEDAAEDAAGSPGVLDNLKSGVLGAVKGALVPGSAEEDTGDTTRNKAGTAAQGGAAEQEEEEEEQQQEEEESRGKMIAMAIATISK